MSEDEEPSIIEYARYHNLVSDHLAVDPLAAFSGYQDIDVLEDDSHLPSALENVDLLPPERLTINREALTFLSDVCKEPPEPPELATLDGSRYRRLKDAKVDVPLLFTDHEMDVQSFRRPFGPDLTNIDLPVEETDDEQDEGINFPTAAHDMALKLAQQADSEKLSFSKETLEYLQGVLKCPEVDSTIFDLERNCRRRERNVIKEHISPPLLPMSPAIEPFVPSSETGRLELLSEHTSHMSDELRELDQRILRNDSILPEPALQNNNVSDSEQKEPDFENIGDIYSPLKNIEHTPPLIREPRERALDLKLSSPMLPAFWDQQPEEVGNGTVKEFLGEILPNLPSPIPCPENTSSDDIDRFFAQTLQPFADKVNKLVKEEQLQETTCTLGDDTLRVKVPVLDFSLPRTPWEGYAESESATAEKRVTKFLYEFEQLHLSNCHWPSSRKAERELRWAPFPAHLAKFDINEDIPEDDSLAPWIAKPKTPDLDAFTWKLPGLRILDDHDSDDEEIAEAEFPESSGLLALMRKRKRELETTADDDSSKQAGEVQPFEPTSTSEPGSGQFTNGNFSTLAAIDGFMSIRMGKIPKPVHGPDVTSIRQTTRKDANQTVEKAALEASSNTNAGGNLVRLTAIPLDHELPTTPCTVIISSTILSQLKLVRMIQELYPKSDLIERDFSLHTFPTTAPNKPLTSHDLLRRDAITHEADMLLSPSTGLILTTLQKLHQRPLPGTQPTASALQTRLSLTAPRYTTLLVLVSHNQPPDAPFTPLGPSDCAAITELTAFTRNPLFTSLDTEVQIIFVPGGERELARWAVSLMAKYGQSVRDSRAMQEETTWEVWLRRAGMNAFAAQVVLAELRGQEEKGERQGGLWGLPRFVAMGGLERVMRFARLMEGEGVLRRVGRVLDGGW